MHPSHSSTLSRCTTLGSTTYTLTAFGLVVLFLSYYKLFAPLETRYEVSLVGATSPRSASGVQSAGEVPGAIRSRESSADLLKLGNRRGAGASNRDARNATSTAQQGSGPFLIGTNSPPGGSGRQEMPYVVLGVATSPKNEGHRSWIRRTWMTLPNVQRSAHAVFLLGVLSSDGTAHPPDMRAKLRAEQASYHDILFLNARETKPPGEKMIGFFRWCVATYGQVSAQPITPTRYCVKTDDDAYIQTVRLEVNLRALWEAEDTQQKNIMSYFSKRDSSLDDMSGPMIYLGATLWASYIESEFQVCGHGMGPVSALGQAKQERCAERGGVGPFPYVAGTLEVLSMPLASWLVQQLPVARFVQRAHSFTPPRWNIGEDTVLGMWIHASPFRITALHWGWDKIHDLCFLCKDTKQLWKPVTDQSVVIHLKGHQSRVYLQQSSLLAFQMHAHVIQANQHNFDNVHRNLTERCDPTCMQQVLPADIPSLQVLCAKKADVWSSYSKCRDFPKPA